MQRERISNTRHGPRSAATRRRLASAVATLVALLWLGGCEGVSHDNIDRWRQTEKGPAKLEDALVSGDESAELRAHAAQNLVQIDKLDVVLESFEDIAEDERAAILSELAPRLWEDARVDGDMTVPSPGQSAAKDALFELRRFAGEATRAQIDGYLTDWFTGGYYEGRAASGRVTGNMALRAVGPSAGPALLEAARSIVARPPDDQGMRPQVGDLLLEGLAYTGHPEALDFLLDLVDNDFGDDTLPSRATHALLVAYVEPPPGQAGNGKALVPVIDRLAKLASNEALPGVINNDAVELLAAVGMPECLPPFVEMVSFAHSQESFRWMGTQRGIRCGQADGVVPVVMALPATADYERGILSKYLWDEILAVPERSRVADAARSLLDSDSLVAQVTGVELLGALPKAAVKPGDVQKIRALAGDARVLRGWWGEQEGVPARDRKADPTLGQVASQVASSLEEVAKRGEGK